MSGVSGTGAEASWRSIFGPEQLREPRRETLVGSGVGSRRGARGLPANLGAPVRHSAGRRERQAPRERLWLRSRWGDISV